ncbi:hypothetical protein [Paraburkholderia xenovorans]|jgi:trimethylamine:corrinoid methyltransferase-like protein
MNVSLPGLTFCISNLMLGVSMIFCQKMYVHCRRAIRQSEHETPLNARRRHDDVTEQGAFLQEFQ